MQPENSWIEKISFDKNAQAPAGQEAGYYYLLLDHQHNLGTEETYYRDVYKLNTSEGIQAMSDISVTFEPAYEKLTFHKIVIHRNGTVINKMPKVIRAIQREESMDRYLYDEAYTAVVNLTDVRAGDIVEYAFTRQGRNPVFKGNYYAELSMNYSAGFEKKVNIMRVPAGTKIYMKNVNTEIQPVIERNENEVVYKWNLSKIRAVDTDSNTPSWHNSYQEVLVSTFGSWSEVEQWATEIFKVSEADRNVLKKETDKMFSKLDDDEFVQHAIRFVQDDVRYLGFENGLNSFQPHSPLKVYQQRYGDCKDKSLLLCTMLETRGIDANPVLVNTYKVDKVADQIPAAPIFDHCVVHFNFKNKDYYVDATINNQGGNLNSLYFPMYKTGLVVDGKSTDLRSISNEVVCSSKEVQTFDLDSIGGQALLTVETVYHGWEADKQRTEFAGTNLETIKKNFMNYYANTWPDIEATDEVKVVDNRTDNIFKTTEKYRIPTFWTKDEENQLKLLCRVRAQTLNTYVNVAKSLNRKAPYRLTYPLDFSHEIHIKTPEEWNITPDTANIKTEYYEYSYEVSYKPSEVIIAMHYKTLADAVPVTELASFVKDHTVMEDNLGYHLSFDRSVQTAVDRSISPDVNPPLFPRVMIIIVLACIAVVGSYYVFSKFDPDPFYPAGWGRKIEGILYLPAFGMLIGPVSQAFTFFSDPNLIAGKLWAQHFMVGNYDVFALALFENIFFLVYLVFSVLLAILFFKRRSSVPRLIVFYLAAPLAFLVVDAILAKAIVEVVPDFGSEFFYRLIVCGWIPYFLNAHQVKRTFVNTYVDRNGTESSEKEIGRSVGELRNY